MERKLTCANHTGEEIVLEQKDGIILTVQNAAVTTLLEERQ